MLYKKCDQFCFWWTVECVPMQYSAKMLTVGVSGAQRSLEQGFGQERKMVRERLSGGRLNAVKNVNNFVSGGQLSAYRCNTQRKC